MAMMSMSMSMEFDCSESEQSLRRRARVLAYRLARGELVKVDAHDRVLEYLAEGYRVPPGMADGAM